MLSFRLPRAQSIFISTDRTSLNFPASTRCLFSGFISSDLIQTHNRLGEPAPRPAETKRGCKLVAPSSDAFSPSVYLLRKAGSWPSEQSEASAPV